MATVYEPGVFYCKDAFEGLETMDQLIDPEKRKPNCWHNVRKEGGYGNGTDLPDAGTSQNNGDPLHRSSLNRSIIRSKWGQRVVKDMPLEMVLKHLNINELYRLSWGAKNSHGAEWEKLKEEFEARLEKMTKEAALKDGWLKPQAVYGYLPLPG